MTDTAAPNLATANDLVAYGIGALGSWREEQAIPHYGAAARR